MKSSQLLLKSSRFTNSNLRLARGLSALFAGALALGLGAASALAQGPYYPQVNGAAGSLPFNFDGTPITTSPEFGLIEASFAPGSNATLRNPPPVGLHAATNAEYNAAVKKAAQTIAGAPPGPVTIASLAAEVAKYRTATAGATQQALGALAEGIVFVNAPAAVAQLGDLAFSAAEANPSALSGTLLADAFQAAADSANIAILNGVNVMAAQAIAGASAATATGSFLPSTSVSSLVSNASTAVVNAAGKTAVQRRAALELVVASVSSSPSIANSLVNLDAATRALVSGTNTSVGSYGLGTMLGDIVTASGAVTNSQISAIGQGALRVFGNPANYATIASALGGGYANDLTDAFSQFRDFAVPAVSAGTVAASYGAVATAAAAATFFNQASTPAAVVSILNSAPWSLAEKKNVIGYSISANQAADIGIATAVVGQPGAPSSGDIAYVAIKNARVNSAGRISKGIVQAPLFLVADVGSVATNAIKGAADASPAANKTDAFADIAFNLGNGLSANVPATGVAVTSIVQQIILSTTGSVLTAPTYIGVVGAMSGAPVANRAGILAAGLAADPSIVDDVAINSGANMLNAISTNTYKNYNEAVNRLLPANTDAQNLAVLYASGLGNSGDIAGGLAAAISLTTVSTSDLTKAAVSAIAAVSGDRSSQDALQTTTDVAVHTKANPNDIQAYIGRQIITNPTQVKEITTAATVVSPQFSHTIAHTLAFNAPTAAWESVSGIFLHSQITFVPQGTNRVNDRPAAGAAITAALTTGILENTQLAASAKRTALQNIITRSVVALHGAIGYSYTDATAGPATFRQSDGTVGGFTLVKSKGVAGGITGFMAQVIKPGDTGIGGPAGDIFNALFQAAYSSRQLTGTLYMLDIAQAAGQAFGWVSGTPNSVIGATAAADIAQAIFNAGSGLALANIRNAVNFGIDEAKGGEIVGNPARLPGAGAAGLRDIIGNPAAPYYDHHSAQGVPVSNIFTL